MSKWSALVEGFGLEKVPLSLSREMACSYPCAGARVLWTDASLVSDGTSRGYEKMVAKVRQNCYCRHHAELHFGES